MIAKEDNKISLMIVGDSTSAIYANAFYNAACKISTLKAYRFDYGKLNSINTRKSAFLRIEFKYIIGPDIAVLNRKLLQKVKENKIDFVFLYSSRLITANTIRSISKIGVYIATYCNDDPFSDFYPKYFWRNYIRSLKYCDYTYIYRESNRKDCYDNGSKNISLLKSYYIEDRNFKINNLEIEKEFPDVVFIGHYERDGRDEYIEALLKKGISVGISDTPAWKHRFLNESNLIFLYDSVDRYNEFINKAKICIVFLSSINRDTYTRRCFEIPAAETMMIAPYTEDLALMFKENEEAVFYNNKEDFVKKISFYLNNQNERDRIAKGGYRRIISDGHEVRNRLEQVLNDYYCIKNK